MRKAWFVLVVLGIWACAGSGERRREGASEVEDPYASGGGGGEENALLGENPIEPPPTENKIELGAELEGHTGVLVERVPQGACHPGPQRLGRPDLDMVLEALAASQPGLQRCYDDARFQYDRDNTGITIAVEATFGENGCLQRAIIADDNVLTPQFTMCVAQVAQGWAIPTHSERSKHRFSLDLAPTGTE